MIDVPDAEAEQCPQKSTKGKFIMNNAQTTNSEMKATVQKQKQRPSMSSSLENTTIQKKPCAALVKGTVTLGTNN